MGELNYLKIAQILGGTLTETRQPSFGGFGVPALSAERFRLLDPPSTRSLRIPASANPLIAAAFERVRDGYEPDRVLIDPVLSNRFISEVRKAGIDFPVPLINKRLQNLRKSKSYGIVLGDTTRDAGLDAEPFYYAAELGFVQLSYRREVSVDDVITDPATGEQFASLCARIAPAGNAMVFKWAALQLRKMRSFPTKRKTQLLTIGAAEIERHLGQVGTLDHLSLGDVPGERGIFSFADQTGRTSYLYVGWTDNLHDAVKPFRNAEPFKAIAGDFWKPSLGQICLNVGVTPKRLLGASVRDLGLRLIETRHPLFNMPVQFGRQDRAA